MEKEDSTIPAPVEKIERLLPNKLEKATETYFLERPDGSVISVTERECWALLKHRQPIIGQYTPPMKLLGVSSGTIYQAAIAESHAMARAGATNEAVQAKIREGWNAEFEASKGKFKMPRNFDIIDNRGAPTKADFGGLRI